jgi:putative phosphoribosyl transferase
MIPPFTRGVLFADRRRAGQALAKQLAPYARRDDVVVLAMPRGGVPVAYEMAAALQAPLDVFLVRRLDVPRQPELAIGAVASGDICILNPEVIRSYGVPGLTIDDAVERARRELHSRERLYRAGRRLLRLAGKYVFLVDDGLATGSSMRSAVAAVRLLGAAHVTVAVPVGAHKVCNTPQLGADEVICLYTPEPFVAVGLWYGDFAQTTDDEVNRLLDKAAMMDDERLMAVGA